jgi:hypothetical protein
MLYTYPFAHMPVLLCHLVTVVVSVDGTKACSSAQIRCYSLKKKMPISLSDVNPERGSERDRLGVVRVGPTYAGRFPIASSPKPIVYPPLLHP